ncbi:MAG TPA: MarR family transcriptional regulator [Lactovum miscens]|uniref:MarR family transcriptional regulator n=1 Tax=Lactovum miscens TaxID=190387 RepID=UPI002ED7F914
MKLENTINEFVNKVSQREMLLGKCESEDALTSTQEHILMLLSKNVNVSSSHLAEKLGISAAAVSKAVKVLQDRGFIHSERHQADERVMELFLTEKGIPAAKEHADHHDKTLLAYKSLLKKFNPDEQGIIERFIVELESVLS